LRRRRFAERFGPDAALASPAAAGLPGSATSSRIFFLASFADIPNAHLGGLLGGVMCIRRSWAGGARWRCIKACAVGPREGRRSPGCPELVRDKRTYARNPVHARKAVSLGGAAGVRT